MTKLLTHAIASVLVLGTVSHAQISTISRYKTWGREVLTSADLNAMQDHLNAKINELITNENATPSAFVADTLTALQYGQVGGNQIVTANQLSAYSVTAHTHSAATLDNKTGTGTNIVTDVSPNMTGTPTISSNAIVHLGNDGSGSGVDADLLDGLEGSAYAGVTHSHGSSDLTSSTGTGAVVLATSPNMTGTPTISSYPIWHSGNDGTTSSLDADLLDGYHSTAFAGASHNHATGDFSSGVTGTGAVALQQSPNFTGIPTLSGNKLWSEGNDGSGSNLDADLLDGYHSSSFAGATHNHASSDITSGTTGSGSVVLQQSPTLTGTPVVNVGATNYAIWHAGNDGTNSNLDADLLDGEEASAFADAVHSHATGAHTHATADLTSRTGSGSSVVTDASPTISSPNLTGTPTISGYTIWHSGNDGTSSTLDADLLDGNHSSAFAAAAHSHTYTLAGASDLSTFTTGTGDIVREDTPTLSNADIQYTLDVIDVNGTSTSPNAEIRWYDTASESYPWQLRREQASMRFTRLDAGNLDKLTIDEDGVAIMGNNNNSYALYVNGSGYATGSWATSSDERYKRILGQITSGAVENLRGVETIRYMQPEGWEYADSTAVYIGVSAQQLRAVYPELVTESPDGRLGVQYANLSAVLLQAIRELDARVATLESAP